MLDHSHRVSQRLGFQSLPIACLVIRIVGRSVEKAYFSVNFSSVVGAVAIIVWFLCLCALKVSR